MPCTMIVKKHQVNLLLFLNPKLFLSSLKSRLLSQCLSCVSAVQCSRGTLSYIQSQCQTVLSNLASDPETGSHRLLSLLPTTLQRCEEIHNEVGTAAAVTCSSSDVPEKLFAAAPAVQLPWPCSARQMTEICHVWTTEQRASEVFTLRRASPKF